MAANAPEVQSKALLQIEAKKRMRNFEKRNILSPNRCRLITGGNVAIYIEVKIKGKSIN